MPATTGDEIRWLASLTMWHGYAPSKTKQDRSHRAVVVILLLERLSDGIVAECTGQGEAESTRDARSAPSSCLPRPREPSRGREDGHLAKQADVHLLVVLLVALHASCSLNGCLGALDGSRDVLALSLGRLAHAKEVEGRASEGDGETAQVKPGRDRRARSRQQVGTVSKERKLCRREAGG